jgi:hypothetical protein
MGARENIRGIERGEGVRRVVGVGVGSGVEARAWYAESS